jgi:hypothetical protein
MRWGFGAVGACGRCAPESPVRRGRPAINLTVVRQNGGIALASL